MKISEEKSYEKIFNNNNGICYGIIGNGFGWLRRWR
jgi:hypothetical protein